MCKLKFRFSDLKIRSKLTLLIYTLLSGLIIVSFFATLLFKASQTFIILVNQNNVYVKNYNAGIEKFYEYELTGDSESLDIAYHNFRKAKAIAYNFAEIDSIMHSIPHNGRYLYFLNVFGEGVDNDIKKVRLLCSQVNLLSVFNENKLRELQQIALINSTHIEKITNHINAYHTGEEYITLSQIQHEFQKIHVFTKEFVSKVYAADRYYSNLLCVLLILLVLFLLVIFTIISAKISNSISVPINKFSENFKRIAKGNIISPVTVDTKNEIGDLSKAFSEIHTGLTEIIAYSKRVSQGDFSYKLKPRSEDDELTMVLNQMALRLEKTKTRHENENWLQQGIAGLDDQMRGDFSVRELSKRIIIWMCDFLNVELGAIYVYDEKAEHLELTGIIGLNIDEVKQKLNIGEGLIGKASLQRSLQIVDVKKGFNKVFSASGEIIPAMIYLLPLYHNNQLQGVIELSSINLLGEIEFEFLKNVADKISANISVAVKSYRHKELLDKTIEQTEKLKLQDEQIRKELEENNRIKENLIREKALLDSMLKTLPDYVFFKDIGSRFLRVSRSLTNRFRVKSTEDIIGKTDFDFRSYEEANTFYNEEQEIIRKKTGFIDKIREGKDKNGKKRWTSVTKLPMYDETGRCIGTFGITKNVTQIKQLEMEVRERNEKLNSQQEEVKAVNDQLKQQQEELKFQNEKLKAQEEELRVANEGLKLQEEELRVANEELAEQTKILSQSEKNLKAQQDKLKLVNKELKQASQYKSEFLANMSHELRTPLNSLLILSKLLGNNKKGNLSTDQLKSIGIIYKSGKDLLELINEILDLSKIEAGKMTYSFDNINIDEIKFEIIQNFESIAINKQLNLDVNIEDSFPKYIYTDRQRFMQIIKNLLSNAFKFTGKGGVKVKFGIPSDEVKFINSKLTVKNSYFVSVEDTGVGIPKNKLNEIFEAFQQADGSISRRYGGTGLGLSISKKLSSILGGEIHVQSKEGVGSTFTVILPISNDLAEDGSKNGIEKSGENVEKNNSIERKDDIDSDNNELQRKVHQFIEDDRNASLHRVLVLIIHNKTDKAKQLLMLCHNRNFNALVAENIDDGIALAAQYSPQAIIISSELNDHVRINKLKDNRYTKRLPIHFVSRIADSVLDEIEEIKTPESVNFGAISQNIENKIQQEYKRILVVEDDPATREAIQMLLEEKDVVIEEAKTGEQAYNLIVSTSYDCVILDLGLPDFTGNELLKRLRRENRVIPNVIIHTARELSNRELKELQEFSDSIVIKGVKSDERLMDEVTLFLHQVANKLPEGEQTDKNDLTDTNGFKGKKVLVVDDDIRNVFALAQILEEREIEVIEAENGKVALEVLQENKDTDLVLMDIMMPVMDGYEAMKRIRTTVGLENIPIITLSAKAMKEDHRKAIESGANDYISKPVDIPKLLSLLKIWLFK